MCAVFVWHDSRVPRRLLLLRTVPGAGRQAAGTPRSRGRLLLPRCSGRSVPCRVTVYWGVTNRESAAAWRRRVGR